MRYPIIIVLLLAGCVDGFGDPKLRGPFDIQAYIDETCTGEGDDIWYIDARFTGAEMRVIAHAVDTSVDTLGAEMQICGVVEDGGMPGTRAFVPEFGREGALVGHWTRGERIRLWVQKFGSEGHMRKTTLHEIGHELRGNGAHLDGGDDIMAQGWYGVTEYSAADVAFIQGAE